MSELFDILGINLGKNSVYLPPKRLWLGKQACREPVMGKVRAPLPTPPRSLCGFRPAEGTILPSLLR